ncbi:MAG: 50S ribosomal protein L13 [Parcubacteria group bacterium RIFOXYD2_FULL_52_8]|nr:MAG: 50S ribosomal protein L13 [Parcubacteria group bacterium RIFOXYD2_FULL_52_8]
MKHTIDATAKSIGRVASEAAMLLMGKKTAAYERHEIPDINLQIINAAAMKITGNKLVQKTYTRYTGYPGGQRVLSLEQLLAKKGFEEAIRKAIRGMLPGNKLRARMLKNIHITN